ncbi:MAG TPA: CHASE2 domain-containing protein, partial [Candidatus Angelobacter sp.]|nr:CHASE2 domain-containing protein [Candidatus Angelobacter sp.]
MPSPGLIERGKHILHALKAALLRRAVSPAVIAVMAALVVAGLGGLAPLEHRLMDLRFELAQRPASGDLVVVEVDNASLSGLGVWPWPRDLHAALVDRLLAAGVRGIAFDIDFSSASTPAADAALADALARADHRVVLPVFKQYAALARRDDDVRYTAPLPMFAAHAPLASVNLQPGDDGLVRLYALAEPWSGNLYPSLGATFARVERPRADDFYLDYGIRPETLPHLSFADILQGRFDGAVLKDKLVIIGATAIELGDQAAVPVHRVLPGVVVQALGYESIAQGRMLLRTSPWVTWSVALLLALVAGARFARWPWRAGLLAALVGSGALVGASVALQAAAPISLDIVVWIIVLWVSYLAALMQGTDALATRIFRKGMALLHRSATMRAVLDDSFDGIIIADEGGRIEHANAAAARMLGEAADALLGRPVARLFGQQLSAAGQAGQPRATELERADGSRLPVELVVSRSQLRGSRHRFERRDQARAIAIWTFRDITERRRAEEAQKAALQQAVAASRTKSEFIANMGHELRTPLNAIIGFSEMLKDQMLGPIGKVAYVSYAADIHTSGMRLRDALNSILDIARIEGGRYQLEEDAVALRDAIGAAVGAITEAAQHKDIAIESRLDGAPPALRADARAIQHILANLLSNAVKFTGAGGRIAVSGGIDAAGDCLLVIADNGIGIPADQLDKVVKPFHQADASLARKYEGVGLGLSLAAGLMELHGGSLAIASAPNAGTTVTLRFPAARVLAVECESRVS